MKILVTVLTLVLSLPATMKIDFSNIKDNWYPLNDGVMGGLSKGKVEETPDGVVFSGTVSLENNGGFASFRGPWKSYDITQYSEVTIRYRSKEMQLAFVMETDRRYWIPNYKIGLEPSKEWTSKTFILRDVKQYRLGKPTGSLLTVDVKDEIMRIGFITDEKRAGDFWFEVASVEFK